MKIEKDIRVEMVRMEGDVAPFVQVDYMDKEAQEHTGLMLLDTGSCMNILAPEIAESLGEMCKIEDGYTSVFTITHEVKVMEHASFHFAFGGTQFCETCCISDKQLPVRVSGMTVFGILGNIFLQKHSLVIDYSDYSLHTSDVTPDTLSISDCSFFCPMEVGLMYYGVPIMSIRQNMGEHVAVFDTGATNNMIAKQTLDDADFKYELLDNEDAVMGVLGQIDAKEALVEFNMLSLCGDDVCEIPRRDQFKLLPFYLYEPNVKARGLDGEQLPPVEIIIGSPFMASEGWVLDFGNKIVYKLV